MGNLKPIGSEKLEGIDKINRMIQIANYNLHVPQSINETKSNEFKKLLADGNTYHIVKEKNGYVIKRGLNESNSVYIEPMKNRKYYSSYSQALKRLNIVANEVNKYEGYNKNVSLFLEDDREVEYYLTTEQDAAPEANPQVPAPAPAGGGEEMTTPPPPAGGEEMTTPPPSEGGEEMPEPEMGTEEPEGDEEEEVSFKSIQKATGKLAQKIRTFLSDEENEMSSKDIKYVINSVLSALNLDNLEEDDLDEIMSRFEGGEDMEGGEEGMGEPEMEGGEEEMTTPPAPEGGEEEMTTPPTPPAGGEMAEMYPRHGRREKRDHYVNKMEEMIEGMFNESHVDKVLGKYFGETKKTTKVSNGLYESYAQEKTTKRFMKEYPQAVFLGKTEKNNLVFNLSEAKFKITPKGNIL
jgi:hypothetical protein